MSRPVLKRLASFAVYQACWWACVLGAGSWWAVAGVVGTLLFVVVHLGTAADRARQTRVLLTATAAGIVVDSTLILSGMMRLAPELALGPLPSPLWLVALWLGFGATLTSSFGAILASPGRAAGFGALAGPLAYFGGSKLIDLQLASPLPLSLAAVSLGWTLALLALRRAATLNGSPLVDAPREGAVIQDALGPARGWTCEALALNYLRWLSSALFFISVRRAVDEVQISFMTVPLIRLGPLVDRGREASMPVVGGLLCRPGGELAFVVESGNASMVLRGYRSRLPRWLYRSTQLHAHRLTAARFARTLNSESP